MKKFKCMFLLVCLSYSCKAFSLDASRDGDWISMGIPSYLHIGSDGRFIINGASSQHGQCAGVKPRYFRLDMDAPHFYATYSWLFHMSKENKPVDCVVKRGCGTSTVWVEYCRGEL
ncbi:hypothetical protein AB6E04_00940 [Vibrio amylolyticus]|uniref:hypothetical protein n=1 Tax=Vibrio amylolyticus TaxID=2847292 RepID=UPI003551903A